jgi:hypothetical protein
MKNKSLLLLILLKINPALVMHKGGKENKKCIANCKNYVYKFHSKSVVFADPLEVPCRILMSLKEHSLTVVGLVCPFGIVRTL